jgi:hypothetical protein
MRDAAAETGPNSARDQYSTYKYVSLASTSRQAMLIGSMTKCCEAYAWFVRDAEKKVGKYTTFESICGRDGTTRAGQNGMSVGCAAP